MEDDAESSIGGDSEMIFVSSPTAHQQETEIEHLFLFKEGEALACDEVREDGTVVAVTSNRGKKRKVSEGAVDNCCNEVNTAKNVFASDDIVRDDASVDVDDIATTSDAGDQGLPTRAESNQVDCSDRAAINDLASTVENDDAYFASKAADSVTINGTPKQENSREVTSFDIASPCDDANSTYATH